MPYNRLTMAYDLADLDESTRARALTTYLNPWHNPRTDTYGPAEYVTDAKPTEYKGFLIYERIEELEATLRELREMLDIIVTNARMIPDPAMQGATDIYAVPLDDIDNAEELLKKGSQQ